MTVFRNKLLLVSLLVLVVMLAFMGYQRYTQEYTSAFIDHSLYSEVLSEQRKIFIRLPKSYDENKTYPVIIKSDGNFNLSRWDESLIQLAQAGKVEDSIVVAIPNLFWTDSRNRDLVPPFARKDVAIEARPPNENSPEIFGRADLFLSFIETEVLPYVEANYKVSENRVLTGFSAGGSFVLYTLITKPELFSGYFAFSPAAWYDDSVVVREFQKGLKNVEGDPLFLYLSIGGAENDIIKGSFKGLLKAIDSYGPANFYTQHSYSEGAGHVENPYTSVPLALQSYYQFRSEKL
ncbi:hypothetical protein N476_09480 [Pseudoalteromonas luteoviolacea H33]|uniref:Esterase n=2 Tax=Pseudoalteromonas luteoviolacea TaxID=43657 RepID=A0A167FUL6_9GAMM|nr:alpha/beta hydrolase-fold protein [Pseudoalteromonas luteoviolacea]KZN53006.1 hypothetical protein N476_09480 [Pseudoalteromonas luteoviolacea H33]KZN78077.1 hypothetical protein N477_10585 [Pseudoalteromonas luteoviolacea H33-S]